MELALGLAAVRSSQRGAEPLARARRLVTPCCSAARAVSCLPACRLALRRCTSRPLRRVSASAGGWPSRKEEEEGEGEGQEEASASNVLYVGGAALLTAVLTATIFHDELIARVTGFVGSLESSPSAFLDFWIAYCLCEMVGIPSIPLSVSSGALFGPVRGAALVSSAGLVSACAAFLIARYLARDRVAALFGRNQKWRAVDKMLEDRSSAFKIMVLLRLAPIFPFSVSNYVYGTTSMELLPFLAATGIGLLPGTLVYVFAGSAGKSVLDSGLTAETAGSMSAPIVGGVLLTVGCAGFVTKMLAKAIAEAEDADDA